MNYFLIPITLFILWIIMSIINPLLQMENWFSWWNKYDPEKLYRCFSIMDIANFKYNNLMYNIINIFKSAEVKFKYDFWVYFIWSIMKSQAIGVINDGLCTPKTLCKSLIPDGYTSTNLPGKFGRVYPSVKSDWKILISLWAGVEDINNLNNENYGDVTKGGVDPTKWSHPTNFLYKWGITVYSPIVVGFLLNTDTYNGDITYPSAIEPLLGIISTPSGGWFGFLQAGDNFNGKGILEVNRIIWANVELPVPLSTIKSQKESPCNAASITSNVIGSSMGFGFAVSALCGFLAVTDPFIFVAGAVIVGGGIGGILTAASEKCI